MTPGFETRIAALSDRGRARLAARLDEAVGAARTSASATHGRGAQLVAYVAGTSTPEELREHLRTKLPEYMVPATVVVLDELPRTATGKIDRGALPSPDAPDAGSSATPGNASEEVLARIWAEVLGFSEVGVDDDFFEMGGDSLLSIRIIARAHKAGLHITPRQFFENPTVVGMASVATSDAEPARDESPGTGPTPLTPIQHWFFDLDLPRPQHWNQAALLDLPPESAPAAIEEALGRLADRHDALRLRFTRGETAWEQQVATPGDAYRLVHDATPDEIHASFDLAAGPLWKAALVGPGRLLLVLHHLVVDGVSWGVLREDLLTLLRGGEPRATTPFRRWAGLLADYAQSDAAAREAAWWLSFERLRDTALPVDFEHARESNEVRSAQSLTASLNEEETRALLQDVPRAYRTRVNDALLTAVAQAFGAWTKRTSLLIDLEGHGREAIVEGVDLTRTVGWFTTVFPVRLDLGPGAGPGEALKSIKEQLRQIPNGGIGHGILRHLRKDPAMRERLASAPRAEVVFNYVGQTGVGTPLADGPTGEARSPLGRRPYLIEINGAVENGKLSTTWSYSPTAHRRETIESLADGFLAALCAIVAHCASPDAGGATPSDFPMAGLDQAQLDQIGKLLGDDA